MAVKAFAVSHYVISVVTKDESGNRTNGFIKTIDVGTGAFDTCDEEKDAHEYVTYGAAQMAIMNIYRHLELQTDKYMFGIQRGA